MTSRQLHVIHVVGASALAFAFSVTAQAGATRTFVSTIGSDSNFAVNCSATANCRSLQVALSVTNAGGEVVVVDSGGYGPAEIIQPVVITASGVDASISATVPGSSALVINTTGNVTITGLSLHGEASAAYGISVDEVGFLRLYNMLIENFTLDGVDLPNGGKLAIYGSTINDNFNGALVLSNVSDAAYVQDSSFDHNGVGVGVFAGQATVVDSSAEYNTSGFDAFGGTLSLFNDRASFNVDGLVATSGATLYFADCLISNNTNAYQVTSGGTMFGTSPGTSLIAPNQSVIGTLSTPVALQ